jgi:hypothetical protein
MMMILLTEAEEEDDKELVGAVDDIIIIRGCTQRALACGVSLYTWHLIWRSILIWRNLGPKYICISHFYPIFSSPLGAILRLLMPPL